MAAQTGLAGRALRLWFGFGPVNAKQYALSGFFLAGVKFLSDNALVWVAERRLWSVLEYLHPFGWNRLAQLEWDPIVWVMLVWSVPFVWIGASMTVRRAADAAIPAAFGLLFFVPVLNYLVMVGLCLARSRRDVETAPGSGPADDDTTGPLSLDRDLALALPVGIAVAMAAFGAAVGTPGGYGWPLFVGGPFIQGFVTAWLYNSRRGHTLRAVVMAALGGAFLLAGLFLVTGLEGLLCILMALPFGVFLSIAGALLGYSMTRARSLTAAQFCLLLPMVPLMAWIAPAGQPRLREVVTAIDIEAPPESVWPRVTSFSELDPPHELVFRLGIAYPMRAHYVGSGIDAVRYCEFSTGAFVEPIRVWEEPSRLAFDVISQPATMHEWSPYRAIDPPHLTESLRTERGEFRLIRRPDGGTRLEGSTWYRLHLFPEAYWTLWSDALIGAIHTRVLEHIRELVEHGGEVPRE